jgi:Flp pilus assembly protein CpaB
MNTTAHRFWNIAIALGLGLLAILLTTYYVSNYKRHVQHGQSDVPVLVASSDIAVGTSGAEVLSRHLLTTTNVPRRDVVPGAISNPNQLRGLTSIQTVYAGEQVTTRRFGTNAQRGIRAQLTGTDRAFELAGDPHQLLAGTLRTGDRVDVVATWTFPDTGGQHVSRVILRNLLVLAAPATNGSTAKLTSSDTSWTQLKLSDAESQKLEWMIENGKWHLELRPPAKAADSPGSVEHSGSLLADGVNPSTLHNRLAITSGVSIGGPK